ncbi:hypothetical protein BC834DRAFT_961453 [Gloeopeniophorella convolvens]|nr:hypothetical protein BC834DRAFT_961453 [Gloeopeniophorella convolvens]
MLAIFSRTLQSPARNIRTRSASSWFLRAHVLSRTPLSHRQYASSQESENLSVSHARFLSESPPSAKWKGEEGKRPGLQGSSEDFESLAKGKGKLAPTSSHLFKLVLPLGDITGRMRGTAAEQDAVTTPPPTIFLLHPAQPLSHVSRLILASLAPAVPEISFYSAKGDTQWANSTDVGDFVRNVARATAFRIHIAEDGTQGTQATEIEVEVPTFADRTRFLRRRLDVIAGELASMEGLKRACEREARAGARRVAVSGFAALVVYWGAVARLTFWDFGWDVMEPITYLSGLSTVIGGYLWFLYRGREVSYSSVLDSSISARRQTLYRARGLDIERWQELAREAKALRAEIGQIARDYDQDWQRKQDIEEQAEADEDKEEADSGLQDVDDAKQTSPSRKHGRDGES